MNVGNVGNAESQQIHHEWFVDSPMKTQRIHKTNHFWHFCFVLWIKCADIVSFHYWNISTFVLLCHSLFDPLEAINARTRFIMWWCLSSVSSFFLPKEYTLQEYLNKGLKQFLKLVEIDCILIENIIIINYRHFFLFLFMFVL